MPEHVRLHVGSEAGLSVWREAGQGWEQVGPGIWTGECRAIGGSPSRPERVYAGVQHDGVYRTDNGGETWTKVLDGDVRSIRLDPSDERVIYAGTEPVGLFRSEDEGTRWEQLTGLDELPDEIKDRQWYPVPPHLSHVLNIFVDPANSTTIYLALEHGGIIRSLDRGETFEDVTEGIDYVDIHMVTKLLQRERYFAATARGFFTTTDPARGWERAENGFTRDYFYKFIVLPPRPGEADPTMIISTGDHSPGYWDRPGHAFGAIFRSRDCAQSWHRVGVGKGLPENMEERAWMFTPHPHNPDGVFAGLGRYPLGRADWDSGPGTVMLTRDRGDSWEKLDISVRSAWGIYAAADA